MGDLVPRYFDIWESSSLELPFEVQSGLQTPSRFAQVRFGREEHLSHSILFAVSRVITHIYVSNSSHFV